MHAWRATLCLVLGSLAACSSGSRGAAAGTLTAADAAAHIGERATVCGVVASTHYAGSAHRRPSFINLDQAYPHQVFTIVIWGDYRDRFMPPPETWHGHLCASGVISAYRGKAEMKVIDPAQVTHGR